MRDVKAFKTFNAKTIVVYENFRFRAWYGAWKRHLVTRSGQLYTIS